MDNSFGNTTPLSGSKQYATKITILISTKTESSDIFQSEFSVLLSFFLLISTKRLQNSPKTWMLQQSAYLLCNRIISIRFDNFLLRFSLNFLRHFPLLWNVGISQTLKSHYFHPQIPIPLLYSTRNTLQSVPA